MVHHSTAELSYWLALLHAPKVGPALMKKLLRSGIDLKELFSLSAQEVRKLGANPSLTEYLQQPDWAAVEIDLKWAEQAGNYIITWQSYHYPQRLLEIASAPPLLFVSGNTEILNTPQLAVVGSRNPSHTGRECAYDFAQQLAASGLTITSGLALGIDAASHRGALAARSAATIAVLGAGLNHIYPRQHYPLAQQILTNGGALVSEFPPPALPKAEHFPRRNRLISGLSIGTLVVEAALASGSLITARYALEQGREVFAIPGSIYNPLARGCHFLLKQGAKLVESMTDIWEELAGVMLVPPTLAKPKQDAQQTSSSSALASEQIKLVECIDFIVTPMDKVIARSGLSAEIVAANLLVLELQGYIRAVPGGYIRKT